MPASWQSLNLLNGCQLLGAIKPQTLSPTKAQGPAASVVVSETGKGLFLQGSYYVWCAVLTQYVFLIYTVVVVVVVVSSWWWWRRWCWWWSGGGLVVVVVAVVVVEVVAVAGVSLCVCVSMSQ